MSFYNGIPFFLILLIGLIPCVILGLMEKKQKYYLLFLSSVMTVLIFGQKPIHLIYLALFLVIQLSLIFMYRRIVAGKTQRVSLLTLFIVLAILPLTISKLSVFTHVNLFGFLGISYVTFRVVQIMIETYDGLIEKQGFLDTVGFLLFFPSISSGPIDRSRRFIGDLDNTLSKNDYLDMLGMGLHKLLIGAVYKFVISDALFNSLNLFKASHNLLGSVGYAYNYGFYLFFDFAGYSFMAIGTAYVFGVKLPENFDKPFISKDIKEFWNRWHITLSHWFRDFIFSRLVRWNLKKKFIKNRTYSASAAFILNMTVMGVWHGLNINYVFYGFYHGVLLALNEIYEKKSSFYKKNKKKSWYKVISWFITFNLVMLGFFIFSGRFFTVLKYNLSVLF